MREGRQWTESGHCFALAFWAQLLLRDRDFQSNLAALTYDTTLCLGRQSCLRFHADRLGFLLTLPYLGPHEDDALTKADHSIIAISGAHRPLPSRLLCQQFAGQADSHCRSEEGSQITSTCTLFISRLTQGWWLWLWNGNFYGRLVHRLRSTLVNWGRLAYLVCHFNQEACRHSHNNEQFYSLSHPSSEFPWAKGIMTWMWKRRDWQQG